MSLPAFPEQLIPKRGVSRITRTVSNVALALGTTDPVNAQQVPFLLVEVQSNAVSVRFDGTAATAADGHILASGYREIWPAQKWNLCSAIRQGGSDGVLYASPMTW